MTEPAFFAIPGTFFDWLEEHHETSTEILVGFFKTGSGRPSITWPESVDQALCFGWIDGVRRRIDDVSYTIRFTPRKSRSTWSAKNIQRVQELAEMGLMRKAGLRAFEGRTEDRSGIYSFEQEEVEFPKDYERQLRADNEAWTFFQAQPPSYRRAATWWVISAKKDETRLKRLASLIEDARHGRTVRHLTRTI